MSLSRRTVTRRIEEICEDVETKKNKKLRNANVLIRGIFVGPQRKHRYIEHS